MDGRERGRERGREEGGDNKYCVVGRTQSTRLLVSPSLVPRLHGQGHALLGRVLLSLLLSTYYSSFFFKKATFLQNSSNR